MSAALITPVNLTGRPLSELDYTDLERRGIARELADAAMIRSVASLEGAEIVGRRDGGDYSGLLIPYIDPRNRDIIREYRLRRYHPKIEIDSIRGRREKEKYLSPPGRGSMFYYAPGTDAALLGDVNLPIVFVEGEFKCLALYRLAWESAGDGAEDPSFLPIAIPGVWNWRKTERQPAPAGGRDDVSVAVPDFQHVAFNKRQVTILFDTNVRTNESVRAARFKLTEHLQSLGSDVAWFEWPDKVPESVNGIDDFIVAVGPEETLKLLHRSRLRRKKTSVVQMPGREPRNETERDWRAELITSKEGLVKPILANVLTPLRSAQEWDGVLAFNEFALRTLALKPPPWKDSTVGEWSDTHDSLTAEWLHWKGTYVSSKLAREGVETVAREHSFHPVREYLDGLEWDGVSRLDGWLENYLGATTADPSDARLHRDYVRAVGSRWLISAVARIYKPGCKADCCLILEGPQGLLKSTALKTITGQWFTDDIGELGSKDSIMQVHGVWIIEIAELDGMSRAEVSKVKAFLSRAVDHFRPPYGARVIDVARQCIFAGSVNLTTYLRDETGGRRFWPVTCGRIDIPRLLKDRDQLWAEAVRRYRSGSVWWLDTAELEEYAESEQHDRYEGDAWDDLISAWLRNPTQRFEPQGHPTGAFSSDLESVTIADLLTHCIGKPPGQWGQLDQNRVARYLRSVRWTRRRVGPRGSRECRYWKPKTGTRSGTRTGTPA
ncbi:MAG: VapE domain-containing protein [Bryobacteraceae bacterium]